MIGFGVNNNKKICFVLPVHPMFSVGGAELQSYYIACEFVKMGYEVTFISQDFGKTNNGFSHEKIFVWKMTKDSSIRLANIRKIYSALKQINADIYYQRIGGIYTGTCSYYCQKHKKIMIWACAHDNECFYSRAQEDVRRTQWYSDGSVLKKIFGLFNAKCNDVFRNYGIRNADICIAQSCKQKQFLKENFNVNASVVKNGHYIGNNFYPNKEKTVLWVANIRPFKNPEIFIKLVSDLNQRDWNFIMIGSPSSDSLWMENLYQQIDNVPNLHYVGFKSIDKVENYLKKSALLINTSDFEGFPNTFIQAWLHYTAVISLFVDPDDIIKNHKLGRISKTYKQLLSDVKELIDHSNYRESLCKNAYDFAIKNHDITANVQQLVSIINKKY
jgi:glycosyltransferase involved in cell wall biosynthesis